MAKHKKRSKNNQDELVRTGNPPAPPDEELDAYWKSLGQRLGQLTYYVDSCAILSCLVPDDDYFRNLLTKELNTYRLFTSSHVVVETVRRLARRTSAPYPFRGPANEQDADLAVYLVSRWLAEHRVEVVCVPESVYELGRANFERYKYLKGWDLTDALSTKIVKGLKQQSIISGDKGFLEQGIMLMPSDAWTRYRDQSWMFE